MPVTSYFFFLFFSILEILFKIVWAFKEKKKKETNAFDITYQSFIVTHICGKMNRGIHKTNDFNWSYFMWITGQYEN